MFTSLQQTLGFVSSTNCQVLLHGCGGGKLVNRGGGKVTTTRLFLINSGSSSNFKMTFHLFLETLNPSIHTLVCYTPQKMSSGYPVATSGTDTGRSFLISTSQ